MGSSVALVCLDVGEKRIGVAVADTAVRIAVPYETIDVDGSELEAIAKIVVTENAGTLVIGYPRTQSGEATAQTRYVAAFAVSLRDIVSTLCFKNKSLTSVLADQQYVAPNRPVI